MKLSLRWDTKGGIVAENMPALPHEMGLLCTMRLLPVEIIYSEVEDASQRYSFNAFANHYTGSAHADDL